jgi:two-component system OmpR family sensor kinase
VKLRTRLLLWYSGVFFVSASALVGAMYGAVAQKLRGDFFSYMTDGYHEVCRITGESLADPEELRRDVETEVLANRYFPLSYRLYDARRGAVLLQIAPVWSCALTWQPDTTDTGRRDPCPVRRAGRSHENTVYFMTGPLDRAANGHLFVELGMSYKRVYLRLRNLGQALLAALGASLVIAVAGGRFLASRSLRPIDQMASAMARIEAENLSARLDGARSEDEIGRLAGSINRMLARLEAAFESARSFTADAAHELRTPLAAARCGLELASDTDRGEADRADALAEALQHLDGLVRVLDDLLLLARLDAVDVPFEDETPSLGAILEDVGEVYMALADESGVALTTNSDGPCCVRGSAPLLRRLLSNLIENAILYTPRGGAVSVNVSGDGRTCRLVVRDTGIGMAPEQFARVFERFYRVDTPEVRSRRGTGLGLSMCRRIAELHGGSISVASGEGQGSVFTVELPSHRSPS